MSADPTTNLLGRTIGGNDTTPVSPDRTVAGRAPRRSADDDDVLARGALDDPTPSPDQAAICTGCLRHPGRAASPRRGGPTRWRTRQGREVLRRALGCSKPALPRRGGGASAGRSPGRWRRRPRSPAIPGLVPANVEVAMARRSRRAGRSAIRRAPVARRRTTAQREAALAGRQPGGPSSRSSGPSQAIAIGRSDRPSGATPLRRIPSRDAGIDGDADRIGSSAPRGRRGRLTIARSPTRMRSTRTDRSSGARLERRRRARRRRPDRPTVPGRAVKANQPPSGENAARSRRRPRCRSRSRAVDGRGRGRRQRGRATAGRSG